MFTMNHKEGAQVLSDVLHRVDSLETHKKFFKIPGKGPQLDTRWAEVV